MPKFLISVIAHNRLAVTLKCVEAVLRGGGDFVLVLTDNASTDGTSEYFISISDPSGRVQDIHECENRGFVDPNERAFDLALHRKIPYLVLLNNDTEVPVGWLDRMCGELEVDPACAAVGLSGSCCDISDSFTGMPGNRREYIEGSCMMIDVARVRSIRPTLFDPKLHFMYGEDADLGLTLRRAGYRLRYVNLDIHHIGAASRKASPELEARCRASESQNHDYLVQKWWHYMNRGRRFDHRIVVIRKHAAGDVLLVTPLTRALHRQLPLARIYVQTDVPEIFDGNPSVVAAMRIIPALPDDIVINLDMASENGVLRHFCASYFGVAHEYVSRPEKFVTEFYFDTPITGDGNRWCAMHVGPTTWTAKNWPYDRFAEVAACLRSEGWKVILVGKGQDGRIPNDADHRDNTSSIKYLGAILANAKLFIGVDSFPMHLAQAVGTPTIGIFGVTESRFIMTDGSPHIGCDADHRAAPRAGERHRVAGACVIHEDGTAIRTVTVDQVMEAVAKLT